MNESNNTIVSQEPSEKKVEFVTEAVKFFLVLPTALAIFCFCFPFLKKFGLPSQETFQQLDTFLKATAAQRTNNTFLYVSGCAIFLGTFLLYRVAVFPYFLRSTSFKLRWGLLTVVLVLVGFFVKWVVVDASILPAVWKKFEFWVGGVVLYGLLAYEHRLPWPVRLVFDVAMFFSIVLLTFRNDVHYFDFSNFICVVNDLALGKDILFDVISQYGFLNMYFLAWLFKILGMHDYYSGLAIANSLFYALGYVFIYFIFRVYTRRVVFSILATFCSVVIHFYVWADIPVHWTPSVGFLRFGMMLPVFYLLFNETVRRRWYWGWVTAFMIVVSLFWVIETGIYIFVSFVVVAVLKSFLADGAGNRRDLISVLPKIGVLFVVFIFFLTVRIWLKYGTWPVWEDFIYYQKHYLVSGLGGQPLNNVHIWPVVTLIYFITFYVCFSFYDKLKHVDAWAFLSFYGLASLLYYISLVIIDHLARVALPVTILCFIFLGHLLKKDLVFSCRSIKFESKYLLYAIAVIPSLILGLTLDRWDNQKTLVERLQESPHKFFKNTRTDSLSKFLPKNRLQEFQYDILSIQKLIAPDEPVILISKHDTLYYTYARRKSFFKIAFYPNFSYTISQVPEAIEKIVNGKARFVFIDHSPYQCYSNVVSSHWMKMRDELSKYFYLKQSLGLLDLYDRRK